LSKNPPDDTKPLSKREEERLLKAGRSVFSTAFPNPHREGCPSQDLIESLARDKPQLAQHQDFILHMSRCSPCYNDFARYHKAAQHERRVKTLAAAAVIVIISFASWFVVKSRRHTVGTYTAVVLDLRNRLVLRGAPETGEQRIDLFACRQPHGAIRCGHVSGTWNAAGERARDCHNRG
jgi:hypothetical protein